MTELQRVESRPWFEVGEPLGMERAWVYLHDYAADPRCSSHPYCVYVHVPYCESICRFCALYTKAVRHDDFAQLDGYLRLLSACIESHPFAGRARSPTTVHFGGGTPLHLGLHRLDKLVSVLRRSFSDAAECEWALEMTTWSVDAETLAALRSMGFRRLHLGVQTLDDGLRARSGLRLGGENALNRVRQAVEQGFACSVDLIMGFEGATADQVCEDACRLHAAGIRMFSVCELRHRRAIPMSAAQHARSSERNRLEWTHLWQHMENFGLRPIHQGQFGVTPADNLYFTHPARGEDCVALGPYANGSAGRLYYGNRLMPDFDVALKAGRSPIGTAVLYSDQVQALRELERELLAHRLQATSLEQVIEIYPSFAALIETWLRRNWLREADGEGVHALTAVGSWYVGNMVMQSRDLATQRH